MDFIGKNELFDSSKDTLTILYKNLIVALKQNDYNGFIKSKIKLDEGFEKLNDKQRAAIFEFFKTLSIKEYKDSKVPANSCRVNCLFGSCELICPSGLKPKCRCEWYGAPDCGCEPFIPKNNKK